MRPCIISLLTILITGLCAADVGVPRDLSLASDPPCLSAGAVQALIIRAVPKGRK